MSYIEIYYYISIVGIYIVDATSLWEGFVKKLKIIGGTLLAIVLTLLGGYGYINDHSGYGMFLFFSLLVFLLTLDE